MTQALRDRIMQKVVVDDDGCWIWTGCKRPTGYGRMSVGNKRTAEAHRVAYEAWVGPIPTGLLIDHLCRVRACVNPNHLEPVTHLENVARGVHAAASVIRTGKCRQGHPFEGDNVYYWGNERRCLTCKRASANRKRDNR